MWDQSFPDLALDSFDWGSLDFGGGDGFNFGDPGNFNFDIPDFSLPDLAPANDFSTPSLQSGIDTAPMTPSDFPDSWDPGAGPSPIQGLDAPAPSFDPNQYFMPESAPTNPLEVDPATGLQASAGPRSVQETMDLMRAQSIYAGPGVPKFMGPNAQVPQSTQELVNSYLDAAEGDVDLAHGFALAARAGPNTDNPMYRDAQHYLRTLQYLNHYPVMGMATTPAVVTGYSALKAGAQSLPEFAGLSLDKVMQSLGLDPLYQASPPSLSEVYWGVKPVFQKLGF